MTVEPDQCHALNPYTALLTPGEMDHVCTCGICRRTWTPSRGSGADVSSNIQTPGSWFVESESEKAFDRLIEATGLFKVFRQVTGHYNAPRPGVGHHTPRIDRILWPLAKLRGLGWDIGPIGVECKRSGEKIGRPISQMLDYSRALWDVGDGAYIHCRWIFLWPLGNIGGPVASIMAQNRLGSAINDWNGGIVFRAGGQTFATFRDRDVEIRPINCGDKVGSR